MDMATGRDSAVLLFLSIIIGHCGSYNEQESTDGSVSNPSGDSDSDADTDNDTDADIDTDTLPPGPFVSDVTIEIHPKVSTILIVRWTQLIESDSVWLEYSFEDNNDFKSPPRVARVGAHDALILGVPGETEVSFQIVNELESEQYTSDSQSGTTGAVPSKMPSPTMVDFNPAIASYERWLLGSVEDSASVSAYYENPFWLFIIDRKGRVVWYYKDPADARMLFPQISRDGTHIIFDKAGFDFLGGSINTRIQRLTLDHSYSEEFKVPKISWGFQEIDDGKIVYDTLVSGTALTPTAVSALNEIEPNGSIREIWRCDSWLKTLGLGSLNCYSNTVLWHPQRDTVFLSMPRIDTALEIDRITGETVSQWGGLAGSWEYANQSTYFFFQHYAHITTDGTLLVSSHASDDENDRRHFFLEYEIDETNKTISETWKYGNGVDGYAKYSGEATLLLNGNRLVNYGTGGIIREVTQGTDLAWEVLWDADFDDESNNKFVGHTVLVDDLYALTLGPNEE